MLRRKALASGILATVILLIGAIACAAHVLIGRFDEIELAQTTERAAQVERSFQADLDQLAMSNRDYAEWDDAQSYILDRQPTFIAANFSVDSLRGMHVDAVVILAANGTAIYSALLSESARELRSPAPRTLVDAFSALRLDESALRKLPSSRRIVRTSQGLTAFSAVEIRRSDKSGATGAVMFFARFVRADVIERVRQTSRLPAELIAIRAAATPAPSLADSPLQAWLAGSRGDSPVDAHVTGPGTVEGFALISDVANTPVAYFVTANKRDVGRLGRQTTWELMGTLAALIVVGSGALLAMILRLRQSWTERAALESRHRNILKHLNESVALADPQTGQIVDANDALLRAAGYSRKDLPSLNVRKIYLDLPETLAGGSPAAERRVRARNGCVHEEEVTITDVLEDDRPLVCVVGRDLSQRKQAELALQENQSRLAHLIEHDPLTELPNRNYLNSRLPALIEFARTRGQSLALMHVDLDRFKNINDSGGQGHGDAVLKIIAHRLCSATSGDDAVVRIGADEFVVVAPGVTSMKASRTLAERLLMKIREPVELNELRVSVTASLGVSIFPRDANDGETLLRDAGIALQSAKEGGRDCYREFSPEMTAQLSEHLVLEKALRRALESSQICVEFQPVVDLQTGLLVSFEALARWRDPELGVVSPARFIPVAERSGLIVPMTEAIVRKVVLQLSEWQRSNLLLAPVAVNVTAAQFERTQFPIFVQETTLEHDVDPRWLAFEVNESAWLQNSSKHVVMIDTLRHEGSRIYIDDFGTGFSNLSYLKTLPVDAVKIDQSFVRGVATDASDAAIVSSIIAMSRQLNLSTVAEGIETEVQANKLRALGCLYGQGHYFSRALPAERCRALLEQLSAAQRVTETVTMRAFREAAR
ncbi:bifunctional diguanylate cyclase/phosphodiesterase [Peristeroidobacter soli]|uniref:bifunctional diguanylate cyclase/phosphodiesterase n=1 Tax=Peristeroidobacter soli TaxID=2497877 RepID=UPI00101DE559|nr:EAL domain-containing protein [Peristeroidobacter soli]